MHYINRLVTTTFGMLAALAGCGGDGATVTDGANHKYSHLVSLGDSQSDVGSYDVGAVHLLGGGKFTINGDGTQIAPALTGKNWTEVIADEIHVAAPCAFETGLGGDASRGLFVPSQLNAGCYSYAQGGARISEPIGPGNAATGSPLGALTVPVTIQIANHLKAAGGAFRSDELVGYGRRQRRPVQCDVAFGTDQRR